MGARKDAEQLKFLRFKNSEWTLTEALSSMFVRRGLPEDYRGMEGMIEETLLRYGVGAYVHRNDHVEDRWIFGSCELAGQPDSYGLGKNAIVTAGGGFVKQFDDWRTNPDIVVAFNTPTLQPDVNIGRYSDMIAETETSLMSQLMNSRLHPIPMATDEKSKIMIDEAIKDMDAGKLRTIVSPTILSTLVEMGLDPRAVEVLNLTDPTASDHIQYISKLREDLLRWFWNLYGHNPQGTGKLAQQSVEEVTTGASISMIIPHTRYHARQLEAEDLKRKFGWDVTIEFAEPWQNAFARCEAEMGGELPGEEDADGNEENREDNDGAEASGDADETGSGADEV